MTDRQSAMHDLDVSIQFRRPTVREVGGVLGSVAFGAVSSTLDTTYLVAKKLQPGVSSGVTAVRDFFSRGETQEPVQFTSALETQYDSF